MLLFLLLTAAEPEDIPLQAIGKTPTTEAPPPTKREPIGLLVGPKLGGQYGVAGPLGGSVLAGVEVGYRLPVLRRILGLSVELTVANPGGDRAIPLGRERSSSVWLTVPLYVSATFDLGPGMLRVLAGPALEWWKTRATVPGTGFAFDDTSLNVGLASFISYGLHLGPGALALELRYQFGLPQLAGDGSFIHSLGLCAAYVFII